jgi:hypothetical protein
MNDTKLNLGHGAEEAFSGAEASVDSDSPALEEAGAEVQAETANESGATG